MKPSAGKELEKGANEVETPKAEEAREVVDDMVVAREREGRRL